MASILHKRKAADPSASDLTVGELAINTSDGGLFTKTDGGSVVEVGSGGGGVTSDSDENTVAGTQAGDSITSGSGTKNTAYGYDAGTAITTGDKMTAIGHSALKAVEATTGGHTAVGFEAARDFTTGDGNTVIGSFCARSTTDLTYSTIVGYHNLSNRSNSKSDLTAIGYGAMSWGHGSRSTAVGMQALSKSTGTGNTGMGWDSGGEISTGDNNTCIGYYAGDAITTGSNNLILGYAAAASAATVSNEITLGDTNITKFRIPGLNFVVKDTTATEDYVLTVDSNGEAGWEAAGGGASAGGSVYECVNTISADYTMTTNSNGVSAGPITVSATVTIPSGSVWSIV